MDLGKGMAIRIYYACLEDIHLSCKTVYDLSLQRVITEEKEKTAVEIENALHLTVSGDKMWKKEDLVRYSALPLLSVNFQKKLLILSSTRHFVKNVTFGVIKKIQLNTTNGSKIIRKAAILIVKIVLVKWK